MLWKKELTVRPKTFHTYTNYWVLILCPIKKVWLPHFPPVYGRG